MSDKDIRDEILERALWIKFEGGTIDLRLPSISAKRKKTNWPTFDYRSDFKTLEEAYAWIMEGKE